MRISPHPGHLVNLPSLKISLWIVLSVLTFSLLASVEAGEGKEDSRLDPLLIAVSPLGGQRGSEFEVSLRGRDLDRVYAVWFECDDLEASIEKVERSEPPAADGGSEKDRYGTVTKENQREHRAVLRVLASKKAGLGLHGFRLVTPHGVSNALPLQIVPEAVSEESESAHQLASSAQPLSFPAVVNGSIDVKGEVDFYSFEVSKGQELTFQIHTNFKVDVPYRAKAELTLHEEVESWFHEGRIQRLMTQGPVISWEPIDAAMRWFNKRDFVTEFVVDPGLRHRFQKQGSYFLSVNSFIGGGGPIHNYQLRILTADALSGTQMRRSWFGRAAHPDPADWIERDSPTLRQLGSFRRHLGPGRLGELWSRSIRPRLETPPAIEASGGGSSAAEEKPEPIRSAKAFPECQEVDSLPEQEPNDTRKNAVQVSIPVVLEGTIDRPGDVDHFRFEVLSGQSLAFEIETPGLSPPHFNPWLKVLDAQGREVLDNVFKEYGGDGDDVNKNIERKTLHSFAEAGSYYLQLRDLTQRSGGRDLAYRILVRPQIPHLGRLEVHFDVISTSSQLVNLKDHMNLRAGTAKEFIVLSEYEEGFEGDVAFRVLNLPPGLEVLPAVPAPWTEILLRGLQYRPIGTDLVDPRKFRAQRRPTTIVLYARPEAPPTRLPRLLEISARPVVQGKPGAWMVAGGIPLMILPPERNLAAGDPSSE